METETVLRERSAFELAEKLFFKLEKKEGQYSLRRKLGGFTPQQGLTLPDVEQILERWKLQGPHGG